jgi:hypothetical protein
VGPNDFTGRPVASNAVPKANQNVANLFTMPDGTKLAQYWDTAGTVRWTNDPDALFGDNEIVNTPQGQMVSIAVPAASKYGGVKQEYDPFDALDQTFRNPDSAKQMVNKVGLSSYTVWLNSNRTADTDPGIAFAMDPKVAAVAIAREVGVSDPAKLAAAIQEAEEARTDYLSKTPDMARRIRNAAKGGGPVTLADQTGESADMPGLTREVQAFLDRLKAKQEAKANEKFATPWGKNDRGYMGVEEDERDAKIRKALEEDPNAAMRIKLIEAGTNILPTGAQDVLGKVQARAVVGKQPTDVSPSAAAVANFKSLAATALGPAVAGAITSTIAGFGNPAAPLPVSSGIPISPVSGPVIIAKPPPAAPAKTPTPTTPPPTQKPYVPTSNKLPPSHGPTLAPKGVNPDTWNGGPGASGV